VQLANDGGEPTGRIKDEAERSGRLNRTGPFPLRSHSAMLSRGGHARFAHNTAMSVIRRRGDTAERDPTDQTRAKDP
jgi:hypothetical protein